MLKTKREKEKRKILDILPLGTAIFSKIGINNENFIQKLKNTI